MRLSRILFMAKKGTKRVLPENYHNLPERYVKKQTAFEAIVPPKMPQYNQDPEVIVRWREKEDTYYDVHRPWEHEFETQNAPNKKQPRLFVQPFRKFPVMLGDRVQCLFGKDKGKQGIVNYIVKERNWVFVEGLNLERRRMDGQKPDHYYPGVITSRELPLLYPSQVQLVDPTDKQPTSGIEWVFDDEGNEVRKSVRTERLIPIPEIAYSTIDYKTPSTYVEQDKDTPKSLVEEVTYKPKLATFEMELMEEYKIEENRIPYQFFWY